MLFVHYDKNIYTPSETVWFTAYLLKTIAGSDLHNTLSVTLIRNDDSTAITDMQFAMKDGLSFGNMQLPDTLSPGNYLLLAHTNVLASGKPVAVFVQQVTIKSATEPGFIASLKLAGNTGAMSDSATIAVKASSKDIHTLISFADVSYTLGSGVRQMKGKLKTSISGEAYFKVPLRQAGPIDNSLAVTVTYKNEVKKLQLNLPVNNSKPVIQFFPEGGSLVQGNTTVIGWEARDIYGEPLMVSGIVYEDEVALDTIQTNGYGFGKFSLTPETNKLYTVKLIRNGQETVAYPLPVAIANGPSIYVANAITNDTLTMYIEDNGMDTLYGMLHNFTENFTSFSVDMSAVPKKILHIPLAGIPKGIATVTLLDKMGRPLAERILFAHFDKKTSINIASDSIVYKTRQKVKFNLQLNNKESRPVTGLVSVACVHDSRLDTRKMTDIESYTFLTNELATLPFKKGLTDNDKDNRDYLEDVLLIKGWRRYTWPDMLQAKSEDTLQPYSSLQFKGKVTTRQKPIKKPLSLNFMADSLYGFIQTDSAGEFDIEHENLILPPGKKMVLFLNDNNKYDHTIILENTYHEMATLLAPRIVYENRLAGKNESNTEDFLVKEKENETTLAEVTVTANKNDNAIYGASDRNECGDYVCQNNVLNCYYHHNNIRKPIIGNVYRVPSETPGVYYLQEYEGCSQKTNKNKLLHLFNGIYTAKEFYNQRYENEVNLEETYLSTIYWNYLLPVNSINAQEISFYTSDLAGKFRVIVQGITSVGVVHGEYGFDVVKKD